MVRKTDLPQPLVAMNIGSSGVRAIAADWDARHQTFRILDSESCANRHQCVEKGIVMNASDVGFILHDTWMKLSNRVGRGDLTNIFICIGGRSLQSVHVEAHRQQRRSEIRQKLLNEMLRECSEKIESRTPAAGVVAVLPEQWEIDGEVFDTVPGDKEGRDITLHATAFVMRKEYSAKIDDAFARSAMHIYHRELIPDAAITALTIDEERENGCAVIDLGAQTTTLTIYKNNQFEMTKVVPLGGYHVSHDLETLGISATDAEKLKLRWGTLSLKPDEVNQGIRIPSVREGEEPLIVTRGNISSIIACRVNEIVLPLLAEVEKSGVGIIYLTGGAAMLKGIVPFLRKKTSIPVEFGSHAQWLAHDTEDEYYKPLYSTLIGTLLLGQAYKELHPESEKSEKSKGGLKAFMNTLFGGEEDE